MDYFGEKSAMYDETKDSLNVLLKFFSLQNSQLPKESERLKGSGLIGRQGDKAMETLSELLSNETAEQDSLQTDALERLTGSGFLGRKGQNIPQILKSILKRPRP